MYTKLIYQSFEDLGDLVIFMNVWADFLLVDLIPEVEKKHPRSTCPYPSSLTALKNGRCSMD